MKSNLPVKDITIIGAIVLTFTEAAIWILFNYDIFPVPEYIPATPIKMYGFLFGIVIIGIYIVFQKKLLQTQPGLSVFKLVVLSAFIGLICEIVIQALRWYMDRDGFFFIYKGYHPCYPCRCFDRFFYSVSIKNKKDSNPHFYHSRFRGFSECI